MVILLNFFFTLVNLKPSQIFFRLYYLLKKKFRLIPIRIKRNPSILVNGNINLTFAHSSFKYFFSSSEIKIHNQTIEIGKLFKPTAQDYSLLTLYHLHYFDYLADLHTAKQKRLGVNLILRWIASEPIGSGISWDSYPLSLRIVNWIKFLNSNPILSDQDQWYILNSLMEQTRFLSRNLEYHLLGNHLFANAKALFIASHFLQKKNLVHRSLTILMQQLRKQILPDGAHFERSTMYNGIILEDCLDIYSVSRNEADLNDFNDLLRDLITRMIEYYRYLLHPDGQIAFINDSNFSNGNYPNKIFDYAKTLGFAISSDSDHSMLFSHSGMGVLKNFTATMIADVGSIAPDYLPAHAHAETLCFELSVSNFRLIVNSGIGEYGRSAERLRQRGTAAHSTLRLDGRNSSEVWGGFRMGRRARAVSALDSGCSRLEASHDGYRARTWLGRARGLRHHRRWELADRRLTVTDWLSPIGKEHLHQHQVEVFYHLHPDWRAEPTVLNHFLLRHHEQLVEFQAAPQLAWSIETSSYHPEFGLSIPNQVLVGTGMVELNTEIVIQISW
ncbi:MAG: alginate lyase family protein [Alphaproteobacteria bacterium]|nr:alginate lyase family protein [Alphaproteobacteria bacterium]